MSTKPGHLLEVAFEISRIILFPLDLSLCQKVVEGKSDKSSWVILFCLVRIAMTTQLYSLIYKLLFM